MEMMKEEDIILQERKNTGTSWTNYHSFEKNGYFIIKNLCDPKKLYHELPKERGTLKWFGKKLSNYKNFGVEQQVEGSLSRYLHPQYSKIHSEVRLILEKFIGRKLYNTYYYDRFYFPGQELTRHLDRPACEISVSVHISSNIKQDWAFYIKTPDGYKDSTKKEVLYYGKEESIILKPGDGVVYKGCERPHWRNRMPGFLDTELYKNKLDKLYYHQIFFHYVLQDGYRTNFAYDRS
tara:strand:- start:519 stop:1226 length:708 start_codon:yes stop_codon:yes gene_type:complete